MNRSVNLSVSYDNELERANPFSGVTIKAALLGLSIASNVYLGSASNHPVQRVEYNVDVETSIYSTPIMSDTWGMEASEMANKRRDVVSTENLYEPEELTASHNNTQQVLGIPNKIDALENFQPIEITWLDTIPNPKYDPNNVTITQPFKADDLELYS